MKLIRNIKNIFSWETYPFEVLYFPLIPSWLYYCIRAKSFWFFSSSNPSITFGGFEGESKKEMYEQLPKSIYPKTIYVGPEDDIKKIIEKISIGKLVYPIIAKPDVGMKGLLFRKIENEEQLKNYHRRIQVNYILQEWIEYPIEVSVFYIRYPWEKKGTITGFFEKELIFVIGDGKQTLWQLIQKHPKAKLRLAEMKQMHSTRLDRVLDVQQKFFLSFAGNHNRGATFLNLNHEITPELTTVFDNISNSGTQWYYGRFDIKCRSIEEFKRGEEFSIIEFNGCGAEPNHIYDNHLSLIAAYREILKHWKILFEISVYNHRKGTPYWSLSKGWKFLANAKKHFRRLEKLDKEFHNL